MKYNLVILGVVLSSFVNVRLEAQSWFPIKGDGLSSSSVINATEWLDAPAGKHGWLLMDRNDYRFADGMPVKFWGVNICNMGAFPERAAADKWSSFLATQGSNGVRFHKFTWEGTESMPGSTVVESKLFDRYDYFYFKLSLI